MVSDWQIARGWHLKGRAERPAYVSLNKRGEIAMNDRAFAAIGRPASVTILYLPPTAQNFGHPAPLLHKEGWTRFADGVVAGGEPKGIIGVKFPVTADSNFYMARAYGRERKMRIVRANRALKQFGIRVDHTLKFYNPPVITYRNEPMLLLELDKGKIKIA